VAVIRYHKYIAELWEDLNLEDLVSELSDFLLQSGFGQEMDEWNEDTLQALHDAILEAMMRRGLLSDEDLQKLMGDEDALDQFLQKTVERLVREGYLKTSEAEPFHDPTGGGGQGPPVQFELTEKAVDFLGYRALKQLLGSIGKSSFGSHETPYLSTGVEAEAVSKPYEFGDTLNIDVNATLSNAIQRGGLDFPIDIDYQDLMVHQSEYRSSAATVLMLDCSHSMILYGEDRFTPAKRVALALAHLVRTQFPGDELSLVLFHDSAEEVPLGKLPRLQVGPYHTNTAQGLKLARQILARTRRQMRTIIMITDGKPSAMTLPDGRIYKNSMGLDPLILEATFDEVTACRRSGILINTFMLARDRALIAFVKRVSEIARGKAYFTTPANLGQFVLLDYLNNKVRKLH